MFLSWRRKYGCVRTHPARRTEPSLNRQLVGMSPVIDTNASSAAVQQDVQLLNHPVADGAYHDAWELLMQMSFSEIWNLRLLSWVDEAMLMPKRTPPRFFVVDEEERDHEQDELAVNEKDFDDEGDSDDDEDSDDGRDEHCDDDFVVEASLQPIATERLRPHYYDAMVAWSLKNDDRTRRDAQAKYDQTGAFWARRREVKKQRNRLERRDEASRRMREERRAQAAAEGRQVRNWTDRSELSEASRVSHDRELAKMRKRRSREKNKNISRTAFYGPFPCR